MCYLGSPLKQAVCSASVPSPLNMTKLNKNLSLEPHETQRCGSAVMTSHSEVMSLVPLQNIRDLKVT